MAWAAVARNSFGPSKVISDQARKVQKVELALNPSHLVPNQEVLIGRKLPDTLGEAGEWGSLVPIRRPGRL
jgi:hypothetical protein